VGISLSHPLNRGTKRQSLPREAGFVGGTAGLQKLRCAQRVDGGSGNSKEGI